MGAISSRIWKKRRKREIPVFLDKAILKAFTEYLSATHFVEYHTCFCRVNIYEDSVTFAVSEDLKGELTFLWVHCRSDLAPKLSFAFPLKRWKIPILHFNKFSKFKDMRLHTQRTKFMVMSLVRYIFRHCLVEISSISLQVLYFYCLINNINQLSHQLVFHLRALLLIIKTNAVMISIFPHAILYNKIRRYTEIPN